MSKVYHLRPEKAKYFSANIEQISTELKILPPQILELRNRDSGRLKLELQGYSTELFTDSVLESVLTLVDMNFKNLQYLSLIECHIDSKRARLFLIVLQGSLPRLKHLNLSGNPLREKGVHSVIKMANQNSMTCLKIA